MRAARELAPNRLPGELKAEVKIVPEAATLLFGHGLGPDSDSGRIRPLQQAIHRMQVSLEGIFRDYPDRLLICGDPWRGHEEQQPLPPLGRRHGAALDASFDWGPVRIGDGRRVPPTRKKWVRNGSAGLSSPKISKNN